MEQNWNGLLIFCRSQAVQYKGVSSEARSVFTGVPFLGPVFVWDTLFQRRRALTVAIFKDNHPYKNHPSEDLKLVTIQRSLKEEINN